MPARLCCTSPEDYAKQALEVKARGCNAYKLHPPAKLEFALQVIMPAGRGWPRLKLMRTRSRLLFEEALRAVAHLSN